MTYNSRLSIPKTIGCLVLALLTGPAGRSQVLPEADVFLVDLRTEKGNLRVGKPENITRRKGYDNQPCFAPDGRSLLYTSVRDDGQVDVYRYDLRQRASRRLTQTAESEYSPTPTPDGRHFSVVRVEKDSTQRLWQFPLEGGEPTLVLARVKPVGYHCWLGPDSLALFVLGEGRPDEPNSLYLARVGTGDTVRIERGIGRAIARIPGEPTVSFVHKQGTVWEIKRLDPRTRQITPLARTLAGSEDYAWLPDGTLLMGRGARLYQCNPSAPGGAEWKEVADLGAYGINQLSRLAVSPRGDRLAVVGF
ncbi:MAG: PD40 domain-containing protein [Ferruginibacter sp.]|nr:PD40 domain-containing protein [Cytophagales bacterium]